MGLTILLLPGMHGTSRLFDRLLLALPESLTPRVVNYPTNEVFGYDELLERIELPHEPFAIVAESYSGPLAIRIGAVGPANLRALILVATFARSPWPVIPRWATGFIRPWLFKIPTPQVGLRRELLGDDAPRDQIAEICEEQRRVRPEVLAARIRDALCVDVRDELRRIVVPILYVGGSRDRVVPPRVARELKRLRPDIAAITLDSPHAVLQRRPVDAAAAIGRFLLEQTASARGTSAC